MKTLNKSKITQERDAAILRDYKQIGDAQKLAEIHGVTRLDVLRLIHDDQLQQNCNRANEYAQAVMQAGEVVYALPAKMLQTGAGARAIVNALQSAIQAHNGQQNVMIAVAVIPVEEVVASAVTAKKEEAINTKLVAATLQAKALNGVRNESAH